MKKRRCHFRKVNSLLEILYPAASLQRTSRIALTTVLLFCQFSCLRVLSQSFTSTTSFRISPKVYSVELAQSASSAAKSDASKNVGSSSSFENGNTLAKRHAEINENFMIYLVSPGASETDVDQYLQAVSLTIYHLKNKDLWGARKTLDELSHYSAIDAGLSEELGSQIDAVLEVQNSSNQIAIADKQLQTSLENSNQDADAIADNIRRETEDQRRQNETSITNNVTVISNLPLEVPNDSSSSGLSVVPPPAGFAASTQLTQDYIQTVETQKTMEANELKNKQDLAQCKANFIQYISQIYSSHHFYHVILASFFYRILFREDGIPLEMNTQAGVSAETNSKIHLAITNIKNSCASNNIATASDQLRVAYFLNPFDPEIMGIPVTQKARIKIFVEQNKKLKDMLEAKDISGAETLLIKLCKLASDFNGSQTLALIDSSKTNSRLLLNKGKVAIRQANLKEALEYFENAQVAWPDNPDLKGGSVALFNSEEERAQCTADFDRLVTKHDYMAIAGNLKNFTSTLIYDSRRYEQLKYALERVYAANLAMEKANAFQSRGDHYGAWETVQIAIQDWPDSVSLNKAAGEFADEAADFVSAIKKAQVAEERKELGYSLAWYVVAQHYYPASQIAAQAIGRLSKTILSQGAPANKPLTEWIR
jgi:tetratricopeptide (TPR) repeat protein